jgi:hypothetical protein
MQNVNSVKQLGYGAFMFTKTTITTSYLKIKILVQDQGGDTF